MKRSIYSLAIALLFATSAFAEQELSLKEAFADKFTMGTALHGGILSDPNHSALKIVKKHFGVLTPANAMKWGPMQPSPDEFNLEPIETIIEIAETNQMDLVGHTLFWHSQTPDWLFEDDQGNPVSRTQLLDRMRERARMMAETFGDRIKIWDVVNESIERDGTWRQSKFQQIIGDDFTEQAFRIAMEELPQDAFFLYNDYGMTDPGRRDAVVSMVKDFQSKGIKIDGIGMQGHWGMDYPNTQAIVDSFEAFASTGLPIHITELDIDFLGKDVAFGANVDIRRVKSNPQNNPYPDGKLPSAEEERFAKRYAEIFEILVDHADKIDRVTFWGVTDGDSWLNNFPVRGRTNFAMLFNREYEARPALKSVIETAKED